MVRPAPEIEARRRLAWDLAASFGLFVVAALLALMAVLQEPLAAYDIIPKSFLVQMDQNAWGERSHAGADVGMTWFYWANNLRVSLLALGLGVLGGLPALAAVAYNGALLGATLGFALEHGVADRLAAWLAPHGVPEFAALVLCGALGMALGRSWLQPGSRGRIQAMAAQMRLIAKPLGLAFGLLLVAAPLEGFVAPLNLPWFADMTLATCWFGALAVLGWRWFR